MLELPDEPLDMPSRIVGVAELHVFQQAAFPAVVFTPHCTVQCGLSKPIAQ